MPDSSFIDYPEVSNSMVSSSHTLTGALYGALDIGTNSVLSLLVEHTPGHTPDLIPVQEGLRTTRLGEGVARNGGLSRDAMERTIDATAGLTQELRREGCPWAVFCATSAVRDATNAAEFFNLCRQRKLPVPHVLSGEDEAELTCLGVGSDMPADQTYISVDVGAGSTELSVGRKEHCYWARTIDLGCLRLTEKYGMGTEISNDILNQARSDVADTLRSLAGAEDFHADPGATVVLTGGTGTSLAAYKLGLPAYDAEAIHGYAEQVDELENDLQHFSRMNAAERGSQPGIEPQRAAIFPAGILIVAEVMNVLNVPRLTVSVRGLRYGAVIKAIQGQLTLASLGQG